MKPLTRLFLSAFTVLAPLLAGAVIAIGVQAGSKASAAMDAEALPSVVPADDPVPPLRDEPEAGPIVLPGPTLSAWSPTPVAPVPDLPASATSPGAAPGDPDDPPLVATAFHYDAHVYRGPARDPFVLGIVRRGTALPVRGGTGGPGCAGGRWYRLRGRGVVCSRLGFEVGPKVAPLDQLAAKVDQPLPYRYARVLESGAPRYYRLPTVAVDEAARAAIADGDRSPEGVERSMKGEYYLAIDRLEHREEDGAAFYRTVRGRYVRADDVELAPPPAMVGVPLEAGHGDLPVAFVRRAPRDDEPPGAKGATLYRLSEEPGGTPQVVGHADKHARFTVVAERAGFVVGADGLAVKREDVRVARAIPRPVDQDIPDDARWVHVDLATQTLVAYEGDRPVYATLVASGKDGYDTPRGHFRIRLKYVSTTMNGDDPIDGFYEVEEVPWTMYYFEGYALHGAYWHDEFGGVRSHGCTNLAPADARWLYYWTSPAVAAGWHGRRHPKGGTHLWFTR